MTEAIGDVDFLRRIEDKTLNDQSLARDAHILEEYKESDSEIRQFLSDRCILITGTTGFLGTILLEKLLRTCPEIRAIFVLIRKTRTKEINQRVEELFNNPVFNILKKQRPNFRRKVFPVQGSMHEIGLGMNLEDRHKIQDQVSVIMHSAATVRIDEPLKFAVRVNVRGTGEMIKLARGCARLVSFVHISTAYSHCVNSEIGEKFYDSPMDPRKLIELVENTPESELNLMTEKILGEYPNTYIYTKAVAEQLIREQTNGLPVSMIRPSTVIGTYREPIRGWALTWNGAAGALIGAGTGFMHYCLCDGDKNPDLVPVDMVANATIACSWRNAVDGVPSDGPKVYNYVSRPQAPLTWRRFLEIGAEYGLPTPTMHAVWFYSLTLTTNVLFYWIMTILTTFLPALFYDGVARLTGKKPRFVQLFKQMVKLNKQLSFWSLKDWEISNDNVQELYSKMPLADQQCFNFDMSKLDWERHAETHIMGLRVYLLKDPASTLHQARVKWQRLKMLHMTLKTALYIIPIILVGYILFTMLF